MTLAEILKLGEMGYTKEEIQQLEQGTSTPAPAEPAPAKEDKTEPAKPAEEQKEPEKEPVKPETDDTTTKRLDSIENTMKDLMKAFQAENVKRDSFQNNPAPDLDAQVDSAFKAMFGGEQKKE